MFPKRYQELLELVLAEASGRERSSPCLRELHRASLGGSPQGLTKRGAKTACTAFIEPLDYGGMLGTLNAHEAGWELLA